MNDLVCGKYQEQHGNNLENVLSCLLKAGLRPDKKKSVFNLGHVTSVCHCFSKKCRLQQTLTK